MTEPRKATFSTRDGVDLKEHVEKVIELQIDRLGERITSVEKSAKIATEVLDKRLHTMNEIRASLEDARANSPTNTDLKTLQKQVDGIDMRMSGFLSMDQYNVLKASLDKDIRELRDSKNILEGKADCGLVLLSVALACISLLLSAIGAISTAMRLFGN